MKKIIILFAVAVSFIITPQAFAEEQTLAGEVSLKGLLTNVGGNKAQFNEYRDLTDGVYGRVKLLYANDAWWLKANANDVGYDTQNYRLNGGMWGAFQADLFYREIPHNTTFGARSMFTGVGTGNLVLPATVVPTDSTTWPSSFDYSTERRQTGGSLSLDVLKPFFFTISAMTEHRKGNKPASTAAGSDLFAVEIPEPIDYRTNTLKAELGYARKPLFLDLYFMYSDFDNKNEVLNFPNVFLPVIVPGSPASPDALTLPPDNKYYKVGFKGAVKLPYHSKLNVNTGWSQTTSTANLLSSDGLNGSSIALSDSIFNGKVTTQNLDVVLTTNPVDFLDGKVFYKYYNRDNKSDVITQTDQFAGDFINHLFDYQKNQIGGELGFRLPQKLYLSAGYTRVATDRHLATLADTNDDIYSLELRWKGLNFMTVRTGYERFVRNADFHQPSPLTNDPDVNVDGARSFDLADKTRDTIKLTVDLYPTDFLSIGVGYKHKSTDYKQLQFGLKSDRRDEVFSNADLMIGSYAQIFGYFDYQLTKRNMDQLDTSISSAASWNLKEKETYYDFGVGTNIFLVPKKLTLRLQYDYARSDGNADFTLSDAALTGGVLAGIGANNSNVDIPNWDDYTKQSLMAKVIYNVTKRVTFALGYAYEKFKYSDALVDGYTFIPATSGFDANGAFLSGAYASRSYKANLYFATLSYKFW